MNASEQSGQLLDKFNHGKISLDELNFECAMWFMDSFKEMYIKPMPTMPRRYADYSTMPDHEKREMPKEFWNLPEIKNYLNSCDAIKHELQSHLINLKTFKQYLPKEDWINRKKYDDKIFELSS